MTVRLREHTNDKENCSQKVNHAALCQVELIKHNFLVAIIISLPDI